MNQNAGRKFGFGENKHIFRIDGNKWEWVCLSTLLVADHMDVKYSVNWCLIFSFWCSKPFTYGKKAQGRWQRCGKSTQCKWKAIVQGQMKLLLSGVEKPEKPGNCECNDVD